MAKTSIAQLKSWFRNGLKPTQSQFWNWMDSYWHKDEKLPMDSIEGIDEYFDSVTEGFNQLSNYAQRDAQNLEEDDIIAWQEALQIGGSNDVDVKLTQTHELLGLDESNNQAEYNTVSEQVLTGILETLPNKMNTPEEVGDPDDFPFIVGMNEEGDTAQLPSTGLGKNIGNSDLTISEPRILDTDGKPFSIANLPDKSADATFIDFLGKSRSGQMAKIGYQAFKNQAESWTEAQKSEYGQILNGGFSTGGISVNMISPPVFEKENNDLYIVLRGLNLNLHPTDRKIEILRASDNTVLAEVPNSQIQTYASGVELIFYYNFNTLGEGVYKLRITSGAVNYVTTLNFQIVAEVTQIDLSTNSFDIITDYVNTKSFSTNDTVQFENEIEGVVSTVPIFSAKSSELFSQGEDWYLEVQLDNQGRFAETSKSRVLILYSDAVNQLVYQGISYFNLYGIFHSNSWRKYARVNAANHAQVAGYDSQIIGNILFIKQGNKLTTMFNNMISTETISNNSGYSLALQIPNRSYKETTSIQILKAYKF